MSFTKLIYKILNPQKISISLGDLLNAESPVRKFLSGILSGEYITQIEKQEIEKSQMLAEFIDHGVELNPVVKAALEGKDGEEIKQALLKHRNLVHSLYYNKPFVLKQVSLLIDALELEVATQERLQGTGYKVINSPSGKR
jgi:hypothetical protein